MAKGDNNAIQMLGDTILADARARPSQAIVPLFFRERRCAVVWGDYIIVIVQKGT